MELIEQINEVVKYGLSSQIINTEEELNLEQSLVKIYNSYFEYNYEFEKMSMLNLTNLNLILFQKI